MSQLKNEFFAETGVEWKNNQGEPDIDYVNWLEAKVEKFTSTSTGSPKLPTIEEVYKAIPFPEDERECAMYVAGLADCHQYIVGRQLRAGA